DDAEISRIEKTEPSPRERSVAETRIAAALVRRPQHRGRVGDPERPGDTRLVPASLDPGRMRVRRPRRVADRRAGRQGRDQAECGPREPPAALRVPVARTQSTSRIGAAREDDCTETARPGQRAAAASPVRAALYTHW